MKFSQICNAAVFRAREEIIQIPSGVRNGGGLLAATALSRDLPQNLSRFGLPANARGGYCGFFAGNTLS
jgi:hypothetical protein